MFSIEKISAWQQMAAAEWRAAGAVERGQRGVMEFVCEQLACNFLAWREENIVHWPGAGSERAGEAKRTIELLNERRHEATDSIDAWLADHLIERGVAADLHASLNTETVGQALDRLGILALRIDYLQSQFQRGDLAADDRRDVERKLALCRVQRRDLAQSLAELVGDIFAGRRRHKAYPHFKTFEACPQIATTTRKAA